jgi:hypothetical protein
MKLCLKASRAAWSDLLKPIPRFPLILNGQAYS